MLSIIISTENPSWLAEIKKNITATAGLPFEIIEVINKGAYGLCKAYNSGAEKALYPYLCFIHDDVAFHTNDWGKKLIAHLQDPQTGLIGVAGGCYKSASGLDWKDGKEDFYRAIIIDGLLDQSRFYFNPLNEEKSRVVCLDGLFLCCRKKVWEMNRFDETIFSGFHFYDADWSMSVFQSLNNYVVYDIEIEHFSHGRMDRSFLKDSFLFEKKWQHVLPAYSIALEKEEIASVEGYVLTKKLSAMKKFGYSYRERTALLKKYFRRYKNYYQVLRNLYYGFVKVKQDN
jgi:glycosyltransferase involved in cell wall biosynthesis